MTARQQPEHGGAQDRPHEGQGGDRGHDAEGGVRGRTRGHERDVEAEHAAVAGEIPHGPPRRDVVPGLGGRSPVRTTRWRGARRRAPTHASGAGPGPRRGSGEHVVGAGHDPEQLVGAPEIGMYDPHEVSVGRADLLVGRARPEPEDAMRIGAEPARAAPGTRQCLGGRVDQTDELRGASAQRRHAARQPALRGPHLRLRRPGSHPQEQPRVHVRRARASGRGRLLPPVVEHVAKGLVERNLGDPARRRPQPGRVAPEHRHVHRPELDGSGA